MQRVVRGEQNQPNKNMSRESSKAIERAKRLAAMSPAEQRTALAAEKTGIKQMTLQEKLDDEMQTLEESYRSAQAANEYRRCDRLQGAMDTINNLQTWLNVARVNPGVGKDGKLEDSIWFDVSRLKVLSEKPVMERPNYDFGPQAEGKQGAADRPACCKP